MTFDVFSDPSAVVLLLNLVLPGYVCFAVLRSRLHPALLKRDSYTWIVYLLLTMVLLFGATFTTDYLVVWGWPDRPFSDMFVLTLEDGRKLLNPIDDGLTWLFYMLPYPVFLGYLLGFVSNRLFKWPSKFQSYLGIYNPIETAWQIAFDRKEAGWVIVTYEVAGKEVNILGSFDETAIASHSAQYHDLYFSEAYGYDDEGNIDDTPMPGSVYIAKEAIRTVVFLNPTKSRKSVSERAGAADEPADSVGMLLGMALLVIIFLVAVLISNGGL